MRRPGRGRSRAHPWTKTEKPALIFWETPGQKLQVSFLLIKYQRISAPSLKPTQDLLQPGQCLELFLSLGPEVQGRDHRGPGCILGVIMTGDVICPAGRRRWEVGVWWGGISTDRGPGRWGYSPCNLTTSPAGQTEWGMQRAQELTTDVPQNMPARHSQTREEFREHGFFSTRSKGHRERSLGTQEGEGRGPESPFWGLSSTRTVQHMREDTAVVLCWAAQLACSALPSRLFLR